MDYQLEDLQQIGEQQRNQQLILQQKRLLKILEFQQDLINQLQEKMEIHQRQLDSQTINLIKITEQKDKLSGQMLEKVNSVSNLTFSVNQLKDSTQKQVQILKESLKSEIQKLQKILERESIEKSELNILECNIQKIVQEIQKMQQKLKQIEYQNKKNVSEIAKIKSQIKSLEQFMDDCYINKKRFNNQLQELRGNIRVYCRIRPFLSSDLDQQPIYEMINDTTLKIKVPKQNQKSQNHLKDYTFSFQQVFDMHENQQNIFNELGQLIQSAVDGKNVCIFTYGQTGSGKTYTMQGGESEQSLGIIPRSISLIYSEIQRSRSYQWETEVSVTIQEVYLQNSRDLINPKGSSQQAINMYPVSSPTQIFYLMQQANSNRKVAETSCNEHSSRSHLIFTMHISSKSMCKSYERKGSLSLVDLAGSQRVSLSKVEGDRMKQTQSINKSLTNLGIVISALAKKQQHVPFRNSKLTYLLQRYLEGDSKTLMLVNISPKMSDFNQTICSLRFAEKVKQCRIKR